MVPGVTRRYWRRGRGSSRMSAASTARSAQSSRGWGLARRNTATSWRRTSSSTFFDAEDRPTNHSQPRTRTKIRYSRRNDTRRDHPGRAGHSFTQVTGAADFWNPTGRLKTVGGRGPASSGKNWREEHRWGRRSVTAVLTATSTTTGRSGPIHAPTEPRSVGSPRATDSPQVIGVESEVFDTPSMF
jgi:hypothetical protein